MASICTDWVKVPGPATTWLSVAFYVLAALAVCLAFYLRAILRNVQNSTNSSAIQRN